MTDKLRCSLCVVVCITTGRFCGPRGRATFLRVHSVVHTADAARRRSPGAIIGASPRSYMSLLNSIGVYGTVRAAPACQTPAAQPLVPAYQRPIGCCARPLPALCPPQMASVAMHGCLRSPATSLAARRPACWQPAAWCTERACSCAAVQGAERGGPAVRALRMPWNEHRLGLLHLAESESTLMRGCKLFWGYHAAPVLAAASTEPCVPGDQSRFPGTASAYTKVMDVVDVDLLADAQARLPSTHSQVLEHVRIW
jgi:hypothetical protein